MKNFSNLTSFIGKHFLTITLAIAFLMIFSFSVKTKTELNKYTMKKDIRGTFISVSDLSKIPPYNGPNTQYFVFDREGKFYKYKQLGVLEKGTYKNTHDDVYLISLKDENGDNINYHIVYNTSEHLYFYDNKEDDIFKFSRISDIPTFLNVHDE